MKILGGAGYRIPTDVEWEHACRAGAKTSYHFGDQEEDLPPHAWHKVNCEGRTHGVGKLQPNAFGLYDMHGNVREWIEPKLMNVAAGAIERVSRGGAWDSAAGYCVAHSRHKHVLGPRVNACGLRVARTP